MPLQRIPGAMVSDSTITGNDVQDGSIGSADLAPGAAMRLVQDTAKSATSTSVEFTGIPTWAKRVTVLLSGVSTSNTNGIRLHLGTASGFEITGYASIGDVFSTTLSPSGATDGFQITNITNTTDLYSATITINNVTGNTWVAQCVGVRGTGSFLLSAGAKTLAAVLTQLRVTGATFDAGTMNILYEG